MKILAQVARKNIQKNTMARFTLPSKDGDFVTALKNFNTAMELHGAALGYDATDEAATLGAWQTFDTDNTTAAAAKDAAKGAVAAKAATKLSSGDVVRAYAQQIKNNPAATPEIMSAFGITVDPSVSGPVTTPTLVTASARIDGTCRLTWNRNGNVAGTTYVIETSPNGTTWSFFATVTATRFNDTNATVGSPRWYRVRASRAGQNSAWSNSAVIYGGSSSVTLEIAA